MGERKSVVDQFVANREVERDPRDTIKVDLSPSHHITRLRELMDEFNETAFLLHHQGILVRTTAHMNLAARALSNGMCYPTEIYDPLEVHIVFPAKIPEELRTSEGVDAASERAGSTMRMYEPGAQTHEDR